MDRGDDYRYLNRRIDSLWWSILLYTVLVASILLYAVLVASAECILTNRIDQLERSQEVTDGD